MEEIWKPVVLLDTGETYEDYMVSNLGRIKSLNAYGRKEEKILKPSKSGRCYYLIGLYKDGKRKSFDVHRLVAFAFVDGYFEGAHVDHIDTNPLNNVWTNLKWVTQKENINNPKTLEHRKDKGMTGKQHSEESRKKISENNAMKRPVICIELNKVFDSIIEASIETGANKGHIVQVCKGKEKTCGGYHWKYYFKTKYDKSNYYKNAS